MKRHDNWPRLLADYIEQKRNEPFAWGIHDCGQFAAGAVRTITGEDLVARLGIGPYASFAEVVALSRMIGSLAEWPARAGLAEVPVPSAQRGFLMLGGTATRPAFGVCNGARSVFTGNAGLVFVETLACTRAWRI